MSAPAHTNAPAPPARYLDPAREPDASAAGPSPAQQRAVKRYILFVFGIALAAFVGWKLLHVIEIVYVSALFAVVLMPIVQRITQLKVRGHNISRPLAIAILLGGVAICLSAFLYFALPPVIRDMRQFSTDLPRKIPEVAAKIRSLPLAQKFGLDTLTQKAEGLAGSTASYVVTSVPKWAAHILDLLTAIILCIYFMLEGENAYAYLLAFFRPKQRERLDSTLQVAEQRMSKWLIGQGLLMLILGVASTVVFGFLHVRYFVLLGVLMGLFNIVPVAGGIITILLAAAVAALDSWSKMAGVFIFYAIYIQIENGFLTPRIMKTSVDLMGLTVLVSLLVGTDLAGITGALVAVPSAALIAVLMDEYMVQKDAEAQRLASEYKAPIAEETPGNRETRLPG